LADRVERRLLTVGCAALALACVGLMPFVLGSPGQWAYILIFGIGSVGGMLALSNMIAVPFILTARRFTLMNQWIRILAGTASIGFGLFLGWAIGFQQGLF